MMEHKKCPACGHTLESGAERCAGCGLTGLNRIFLSRQEYLAWVSKVLQPHKDTLTPSRVYAGADHVLILTGGGKLYGLGKNWGQIMENGDKFYDQPKLMAADVIHAAAGRNYSIYVTKDGEVHLQGTSHLADRFPGFSGAAQVYADLYFERFWIVDKQGDIYFIGDNMQKSSLERQPIDDVSFTLVQLPEESCVFSKGAHERPPGSHGWHTQKYDHFDNMYVATQQLKEKIMAGEVYRQMAKTYGYGNLHLSMELISEQYLGGEYYSRDGESIRLTFLPTISFQNIWIYTPERYQGDEFVITPYWDGSMPRRFSAFERHPQYENIKKCAYFWKTYATERNHLLLSEDGQMRLINEYGKEVPLKWTVQPVYDLAVGFWGAILSCQSGELLWVDPEDLKKGDFSAARRITLPTGEA